MRERKIWRVLRVTPFIAAALLVAYQFAVQGEGDPIIGWTWVVVATVSLILADIVRRYTRNLLAVSSTSVDRDSAWRFNMESNHSTAVLTETIHLIFVCVGIGVTLFPESELRRDVSTTGILLGQFILLLIVCRTYLSYSVTAREVDRTEEEREDRVVERIDAAAEVASERHEQYTDAHMEMLRDIKVIAKDTNRLARDKKEQLEQVIDHMEDLEEENEERAKDDGEG